MLLSRSGCRRADDRSEPPLPPPPPVRGRSVRGRASLTVMEDIHAEKQFRAREFLVAREGEMNILASPYYLEAGGTVIDWELVRRARKRKRA
jgi:hypothetical protein